MYVYIYDIKHIYVYMCVYIVYMTWCTITNHVQEPSGLFWLSLMADGEVFFIKPIEGGEATLHSYGKKIDQWPSGTFDSPTLTGHEALEERLFRYFLQ